MKKIIAVVFAVVLMANEAYAFKAFGHQTIAALAEKHLTDNAKREVKAILKDGMIKHSMWLYSLRSKSELANVQTWQFTTLNAEGKSTTTDENDCVVAVERAAQVLRDRKNESDSLVRASLLTIIQLVGDMHNISNIRIEGIEATKGFTYAFNSKKNSSGKWHTLWHNYTNRHDVFSPEYYAADIEIFIGEKKAEYEKGTPRFWAENVGEDVVRCLEVVNPEIQVTVETVNRFEDIHNKCMAKAGYRLAALLNDIFK